MKKLLILGLVIVLFGCSIKFNEKKEKKSVSDSYYCSMPAGSLGEFALVAEYSGDKITDIDFITKEKTSAEGADLWAEMFTEDLAIYQGVPGITTSLTVASDKSTVEKNIRVNIAKFNYDETDETIIESSEVLAFVNYAKLFPAEEFIDAIQNLGYTCKKN